MVSNKMFVLLYIKNAVMLCVMMLLVLAIFDTAMAEVKDLAAQFTMLSDSLKVMSVLGLATIPAILTKIEVDLIDSLFPPEPTGLMHGIEND